MFVSPFAGGHRQVSRTCLEAIFLLHFPALDVTHFCSFTRKMDNMMDNTAGSEGLAAKTLERKSGDMTPYVRT